MPCPAPKTAIRHQRPGIPTGGYDQTAYDTARIRNRKERPYSRPAQPTEHGMKNTVQDAKNEVPKKRSQTSRNRMSGRPARSVP